MPSRIFSLAFQLGTFIQENSGIQEYERASDYSNLRHCYLLINIYPETRGEHADLEQS